MGVERDGEGSDEAEECWGLGCLFFGFGFERSKAWAGRDGPWAVIFVSMGGFAMKIGYPVLLVPDSIRKQSGSPWQLIIVNWPFGPGPKTRASLIIGSNM
jgi:hypothetical protein